MYIGVENIFCANRKYSTNNISGPSFYENIFRRKYSTNNISHQSPYP